MNKQMVNLMEQEVGRVRSEIRKLQSLEQKLVAALEAYRQVETPVVPTMDREKVSVIPTSVAPISATDILYQPRPVTDSGETIPTQSTTPNTLEMTRIVLRNAGGEKTADELRQLIRTTYGIEPAKSLDQMLYKRAASGRGFYKTEDGRFGLTEMRKGTAVDAVAMPGLTQLQ